MSDMVDRVARAIASVLKEGDMAWDSDEPGTVFIEDVIDLRRLARVAIEAMQPSLQAAQDYADECEAKIAFLIDQIDKMLQASQASSQSKPN